MENSEHFPTFEPKVYLLFLDKPLWERCEMVGVGHALYMDMYGDERLTARA